MIEHKIYSGITRGSYLLVSLFAFVIAGFAQDTDSVAVPEQEIIVPVKRKPVKNTFESIWIIDNQTVMVPAKKTFEMDIMHRFGTMKNKYKDFYGFFAPSNIRLGFSYVVRNNLMIGASLTKENMMWEGSAKYSILKQIKGVYPVSVTYFGNLGIKTKDEEYRHFSDRLSYFNQLLIARKINEKLSLQVAPSHSHINVVNGIYKTNTVKAGTGEDSTFNTVIGEMKHNHFAVAFSGRYKIKEAMAILVNYDQPITKHPTRNPNPNFSFGIEVATSAHAFQFFLGNYYYITPQMNNFHNHNDPAVRFKDKYRQFLIGFNITRLWSY
jgi:hypothetical protein